jgi:hypothetical protein
MLGFVLFSVKLTGRLRPDWSLRMHGAITPLNIRPTGLQKCFNHHFPQLAVSPYKITPRSPVLSNHSSISHWHIYTRLPNPTLMMATVMLAETFRAAYSWKAETTHRSSECIQH